MHIWQTWAFDEAFADSGSHLIRRNLLLSAMKLRFSVTVMWLQLPLTAKCELRKMCGVVLDTCLFC
jgi:hypothetical protein